jgi:hypothetical protein
MPQVPSRRSARLALVSSRNGDEGRTLFAAAIERQALEPRGRKPEAPASAEDVREATNRRYVHGSMTPRQALEQVVYDPFYPIDLRHAAALELIEALREPQLTYRIERSPELWGDG